MVFYRSVKRKFEKKSPFITPVVFLIFWLYINQTIFLGTCVFNVGISFCLLTSVGGKKVLNYVLFIQQMKFQIEIIHANPFWCFVHMLIGDMNSWSYDFYFSCYNFSPLFVNSWNGLVLYYIAGQCLDDSKRIFIITSFFSCNN